MARKITPADRKLAVAMRRARELRGFSQELLGEKLGVSFQQIQKRETAKNRISATDLVRTASALELPLEYFLGSDRNANVCVPNFKPNTTEFARKFERLNATQRAAISAVINAAIDVAETANASRCPNTMDLFTEERAA